MYFKETSLKQIKESLSKHYLTEANINTDYEKGEITMVIKMSMSKSTPLIDFYNILGMYIRFKVEIPANSSFGVLNGWVKSVDPMLNSITVKCDGIFSGAKHIKLEDIIEILPYKVENHK